MPRPNRRSSGAAGTVSAASGDRPFDPEQLQTYFRDPDDAVDTYAFDPDDAALPGELADVAADAPFDFDARLRTVPDRPGVYLMRDQRGQVVYVGKAASLRARLRQYASGQDERFFVEHLRDVLGAIDVVVTATAKEALLLENELIKQHQPRFNVKLKDDKRFLHLRLDPAQPFARLQVVRRPAKDGAQYFGPYASASAARAALAQINRHFLLRTCPDSIFANRTRPCLEYQIRRCLGPCTLPVDPEDYAGHVRDVALFLSGRRRELVDRLKQRMAAAAQAEEYERAARIRDHIRALQTSLETQHTVLLDQPRSLDVVGIYRQGARVCVAILPFREGVLLGSQGHVLKDQQWADAEVIAGFLQLAYDRGRAVPDEVVVPVDLADAVVLAEWLTDLRRQRADLLGQAPPRGAVDLVFAQRGPKVRLLQMAAENAEQVFADHARTAERREATLVGLQRNLHLRRLPRRIECYDISNISGTDPTGSMAVALDGDVAPAHCRTFAVRSQETPNDFLMMREVLSRRLERAKSAGWPLPDLVVVDGGKGQLKAVELVFEELGLGDFVDLVGLAKARTLESDDRGVSAASPERVFLRGIKNPVVLPQNSNEIYLLTRLRDEAHRLAVTLHRKRRGKRTLRSKLDGIPGVGEAKRKALLSALGSVKAVAAADADAIAQVPGIGAELARRIVAVLRGSGRQPPVMTSPDPSTI
ncbi:MAG: excinuclease ABC subunit UvrC [Deltaproteobacteria bacterium]|nr:excinuclease ABC subunit UvrC [Deltaproteobacteria bacterium]